MQHVTIQLDDAIAKAAEERAQQEHTTLDQLVASLLVDYLARQQRGVRFDEPMADLRSRIRWDGTPIKREERHER
mgnify:CR=1 FL=1